MTSQAMRELLSSGREIPVFSDIPGCDLQKSIKSENDETLEKFM